MSFQANPESMLRYPEQMQHDGLLTEQDQKFITEFFNTIATEEPPNHMMDITHHSQASLSFHGMLKISINHLYLKFAKN